MTERRRTWAWALAASAAALLVRSASLNLFLDRDEGEYATLAWLWRSGAGLPYRDWLEQKPPLAIAMNALAQWAFSDGVLGLRVVSLAWVLATVVALFVLVDALARRGRMGWRLQRGPGQRAAAAGLAALLAALLLSELRTQSLAANTETWQTLPLLGALALLFLPEPRSLGAGRHFAAGILIGIAALFKQTAFSAVVLLPWAAQDSEGGQLRFGRAVAWTLLGGLLPWALCIGIFAAQGGALEFLQCTIGYNEGYVLQGLQGAFGHAFGLAWHLAPVLAAPAWLAWLGWRALGRDRARRGWLGAWLAVGALALASSGRFYPHYVVLLLAPLAVLAAVGLMGLQQQGPGWTLLRAPRALRLVLAALTLCGFAWCDGVLWERPGGADRTASVYRVPTFVTAPEAAVKLRQICPPGEAVFIWGDDPELYYLAQRRPATRFLFTYPFTGEAPPWPGGDHEMLTGLMDSGTGAAVMSKGLDPNVPMQEGLFRALKDEFKADDSVQGYILGARRR